MRLSPLVLLLAFSACGESKKSVATVGPAGGTVKSGDASVTIPAGALTREVAISVELVSDAPVPPGVDPVSTPIRLLPEGQSFAQPVTVRLPVDLNAIPVGKSLADVLVFTAPSGSMSWSALATSVDGARGVRTEVDHFSLFVAGVVKPGVDFSVTLTDMSVPVTDGGASGDLAAADLADRDAACSRNYLTNTTSCSLGLAATCDGHSYQISCTTADMQIWDCVCSKDGSTTKTYFGYNPSTGGACSRQKLESDWIAQCAFGALD